MWKIYTVHIDQNKNEGDNRKKELEPLAALITLKDKSPDRRSCKIYISEEKEVKTAGKQSMGRKISLQNIFPMRRITIYIRRSDCETRGKITSIAKDAQTESVYEMYYEFEEPITKLAEYRILALNRGEKEKILTVKVELRKNEFCNIWKESHFFR